MKRADQALEFIRANPGRSQTAILRGIHAPLYGTSRDVFPKLEQAGLIRIEKLTPTFTRVFAVEKGKR